MRVLRRRSSSCAEGADRRDNGQVGRARVRRLALALSTTCVGLAGAAAQDRASPLRAEQVQGIERFAGNDAQRALLLDQRFVVVDGGTPGGELLQTFSAYVDPPVPVFVTVDAALDAWSALLRRAVADIERRQMAALLEFDRALAQAAQRLDGDAGARVARLCDVALALQCGERAPGDPDVRAWLQRLERGNALLPCVLPIELAALQPVGDLAAGPAGAGYFCARRFWQQLAIRLDDPDGRALAAALAQCRAQDEAVRRAFAALCAPFERLLGPALPSVCGAEPAWIAQQRAGALGVLPAFRSLYGDLAAATAAVPQLSLPVPPPLLLLAVGPLASPAGQRLWRAHGGSEAATRLPIADPPESMLGRFVHVLQELQRSDARAEPLFASAAWADLQANAQLAAWAQSHHAFALEERFVSYGCLTGSAPTRVAPCPRAFAGLAACAADLGRWRRAAVAREDRVAAQAQLAAWAKVAARIDAGDRSEEAVAAEDQGSHGALSEILWSMAGREHAKADRAWRIGRARALSVVPPEQLSPALAACLDECVLGALGGDLDEFASWCTDVGAIAAVQLAGTALTERQDALLENVHETLGHMHGYHSNCWINPRDDHARIAPLGFDQNMVLHAGLARPEYLWLVLDHAGAPTLYRGAVLSYRECTDGKAIPDAEWRQRVAAGRAPPPPFAQSFRR